MEEDERLRKDIAFLEALLEPSRVRSIDVPLTEALLGSDGQTILAAVAYWDKRRKEQIRKMRQPATQSLEERPLLTQRAEAECDVLIVCPLAKEQEMSCLAFGIDPEKPSRIPGGTKEYIFEVGRTGSGRAIRATLSVLNRQQNIAAASRMPGIISRSKPRVAMLAGIGATFEGKKMNHVMAANIVYYTSGGVETPEDNKPRPIPLVVDSRYESLLNNFDSRTDKDAWKKSIIGKLLEIITKIDAGKPSTEDISANGVEFSVGSIMSQERLRRDGLAAVEASRLDERMKSIEMEAAGFALACQEAQIPWLVFRSHCDYADPNKNDIWQRSAALAAALTVKTFLETEFCLPNEMEFG